MMKCPSNLFLYPEVVQRCAAEDPEQPEQERTKPRNTLGASFLVITPVRQKTLHSFRETTEDHGRTRETTGGPPIPDPRKVSPG